MQLGLQFTASALLLFSLFGAFILYENLTPFSPSSFSFFQGQEIISSEKWEEIFARRRSEVSSVCKKLLHRWPQPGVITHHRIHPPNWDRFFFVDDAHQVVFCGLAKVASTNWRRYFYLLSYGSNKSAVNPEYINQEWIHSNEKQLRPLKTYKFNETQRILRDYKKITFVRNPMDRIYSAWASKLAIRSYRYPEEWGQKMIKDFRPNCTKKDWAPGYPVRLEEFFQFLLRNPFSLDAHWSMEHIVCNLCGFPYDYIGHFEKMDEEASYLINHVIKPKNLAVTFPSPGKTSSPTVREASSQMRSLNNVSRELLHKVMLANMQDFQILGYDFEQTFKDYENYLCR